MKRSKFKRLFTIFLPVALIAFLIIAITLTFGTSDAGKAMGVLEGVIVFLIGIWLLFLKEINGFFKKYLGPLFSRHSKGRADPSVLANSDQPVTREKVDAEEVSTDKDNK